MDKESAVECQFGVRIDSPKAERRNQRTRLDLAIAMANQSMRNFAEIDRADHRVFEQPGNDLRTRLFEQGSEYSGRIENSPHSPRSNSRRRSAINSSDDMIG